MRSANASLTYADMPDNKIKETLLEQHFIKASIELAEINMREDLRQEDKNLRMNEIWKGFKRFIYANYDEK